MKPLYTKNTNSAKHRQKNFSLTYFRKTNNKTEEKNPTHLPRHPSHWNSQTEWAKTGSVTLWDIPLFPNYKALLDIRQTY